jgi:trehalose/maltose transport system substrate-binding protein
MSSGLLWGMKAFPSKKRPYHCFRRNLVRLVGAFFLVSLSVPRHYAAGETVRFAGDSDQVGESGRWTRAVAEEWAEKTNNTVEYISRPADATATLQLYLQYWGSKSPDVDVYMVDVIWQGIAAPHAVDLKKFVKADDIKAFFPRSVENNTVNGRLVSIPWFIDAGLLYYRTDLLAKYGYKAPPQTWEELAEMAKKIQDGERAAGNPDFQGFVFEGKSSESLTCDAVEWIYSYGGGTIIDPDKKVTINNPNAIKALETAKSWIGTISSTNVTNYGEEEARNIWQAGNAAFMRNWPYAYPLGADPKSPISGKFDVTVLPKGSANGKNPGCLGGWQLMVSAYSKVPNASLDLIRYLTSSQIQKKHAIDLGLLPTLPVLYSDPEILEKIPWFKNAPDILANVLARPSTVTGASYNRLSKGVFENVNKVLGGEESAQDAVLQIEQVAKRIMP